MASRSKRRRIDSQWPTHSPSGSDLHPHGGQLLGYNVEDNSRLPFSQHQILFEGKVVTETYNQQFGQSGGFSASITSPMKCCLPSLPPDYKGDTYQTTPLPSQALYSSHSGVDNSAISALFDSCLGEHDDLSHLIDMVSSPFIKSWCLKLICYCIPRLTALSDVGKAASR